jgi:hypothetical protein
MIFKQWQQVLDGTKTQTRRILRTPVEIERLAIPGAMHSACPIQSVRIDGRLIEAVGHTRAVQPGRTKPGIAGIEITALRVEFLHRISEADAIAEGCHAIDGFAFMDEPVGPHDVISAVSQYRTLWDSINTRPGTRWIDNPLVLVREFRLVQP